MAFPNMVLHACSDVLNSPGPIRYPKTLLYEAEEDGGCSSQMQKAEEPQTLAPQLRLGLSAPGPSGAMPASSSP